MNDQKSLRQTEGVQPGLPSATLLADSFAYSTIEEYEELVGFKVNEAFRIGWLMARTMNSHLGILAESANAAHKPSGEKPR
jgi:hypothetical protein